MNQHLLVLFIDHQVLTKIHPYKLLLPNSNVYITGDFNINLLKNNLDEYESFIFGSGFTTALYLHFQYLVKSLKK